MAIVPLHRSFFMQLFKTPKIQISSANLFSVLPLQKFSLTVLGSFASLQFSHICALFCLHLEGGIIQQPSGVVLLPLAEIVQKY